MKPLYSLIGHNYVIDAVDVINAGAIGGADAYLRGDYEGF